VSTAGGEALDMLQAMNTGHDGSLSTAHANTRLAHPRPRGVRVRQPSTAENFGISIASFVWVAAQARSLRPELRSAPRDPKGDRHLDGALP
jgi:Flp pilus assembly CpaF family ATPase